MRIGKRTQAFEWYHLQRPWVTFKSRFSRPTVVLLCAQLMRNLFAIAKFLVEIWFCSAEPHWWLTLYGYIKTAEQRTIIRQYGDWYTGRWWVGCYIWYSEEVSWAGWGPAQSPPRCTKCNSPPINGQCTHTDHLLANEVKNKEKKCTNFILFDVTL